ncbi:Rrf2 family transcriptional regulator [Aerococcus agrisoli]|uniref:Rrf2 family transcriptional regulator n=1 Tax=Aerococcus agrisoli TaxID=2487350 RepID=A0A3N4GB30_9LACT|nr:Rrf2 family transcriptional regulator [Aerococcus agrisoli]RPA59128.1 Rrf2 family transcriptional regulator [Aerococcus agrisoli]
MKMKSGVEQALCIMIMLATQIDHRPLKSTILSRRLDVSDSYLKKIMRSLVVSGLVHSIAGKDGGFVLKKSPKDMTMLHIYEAIEGEESFVRPTNLAEKVFIHADKIKNKKREVLDVFFDAEQQFKQRLQKYTLESLLMAGTDQVTTVDWETIVSTTENE